MKKTYDKWIYELTDTFGGEANYSWVRRGEVSVSAGASPVRAVKRALDLQGIRCRVENWGGDTIALYPSGACVVCFISWGC